MSTEIRILIADTAALFSLYRWLDADTHLDPGTRIALIPAQAVTATVAGVAGMRGLAQSYAAWHSSRSSTDPCPVTFEARASRAAEAMTVTVTVAEGSIQAIEAISALVPE